MAKDRVQVQDLYKDRGYLPGIQPRATPVDTYVSPAKPEMDIRLLELANAWSDVQPGLTRFAQQRVAKYNEDEAARGRKAALESKQAFKEAVKSGQIPAGASPWFKVGYERQKATVTSLQFKQQLMDEYQKGDLAGVDDPRAVSKWMQDKTQKWLEENPDVQSNPEFERIFSVMGPQIHENLQNTHAAERSKRIEQEVIQDTDFMLGATLDNAYDEFGNTNPNLGQELATIVGEQVSNGLSGPVANKLVAESVIRKAVQEGDVTLLDLLNEVPSGSGTVGQIGYVKDAVTRARDQITYNNTENHKIQSLKAEEDKKILIDSLRSSAQQKLIDNPYADVGDEFTQLNLLDPDEATKLPSFRSSVLSSIKAQASVIENEPEKQRLLGMAIRGELTVGQVMQAGDQGLIDYSTIKDLVNVQIPKGKENKSFIKDPVIVKFEKAISDTITKNELSDDFSDGRKSRATEATTKFLQGMIQYRASNPDASELDQIRYAKDFHDAILDIYREDGAEPLPDVSLENKDPTKDTFFKDTVDLDDAIKEYNKSGKGKLKALADTYQMTPEAFAGAQQRIYLNKK